MLCYTRVGLEAFASLKRKFFFSQKENLRNTSHAWQELYNLFKLKMRMYNVHATILGYSESSKQKTRPKKKIRKKILFELKLSPPYFWSWNFFNLLAFFSAFAFPSRPQHFFFASVPVFFMSEKCIILWFTWKRSRKKEKKHKLSVNFFFARSLQENFFLPLVEVADSSRVTKASAERSSRASEELQGSYVWWREVCF